MHVLEAGFDEPGRPLVLLLHGFPELAWSWRKVMPALAAAGFRVVAPDQRGFGRTTGWDPAYDGDLASFRPLSLMQDLLSLIFSMDYGSVTAVVGHDFGSPVAAHCALIRPDIFTAVVMMSAPFAGPPPAGPAPAPGRPRTFTPLSAGSRRRASTTRSTTRPGGPRRTCSAPRKACMTSSAPTSMSRAATGRATNRIP